MNQETPSVPPQQEKVSDKEFNFRQLEKQLAQERAARIEAEKAIQEAQKRQVSSYNEDDDDDSEPYVDVKKLNKKLNKFGEQQKQYTQQEIKNAVAQALEQERQQSWIRQNNDFFDVMQHAKNLYDKDPELAETILNMPDNFERQKLVYKNIKALGLHKPPQKEPSIQETIDRNKRSPYYQPSGMSSPPYASVGDFSKSGQKNAYDKMKELQARLNIR